MQPELEVCLIHLLPCDGVFLLTAGEGSGMNSRAGRLIIYTPKVVLEKSQKRKKTKIPRIIAAGV